MFTGFNSNEVVLPIIWYPAMRPRGDIGYPHVSLMDVELRAVGIKLVGGEDESGSVVMTTAMVRAPGPILVDACTHRAYMLNGTRLISVTLYAVCPDTETTT